MLPIFFSSSGREGAEEPTRPTPELDQRLIEALEQKSLAQHMLIDLRLAEKSGTQTLAAVKNRIRHMNQTLKAEFFAGHEANSSESARALAEAENELRGRAMYIDRINEQIRRVSQAVNATERRIAGLQESIDLARATEASNAFFDNIVLQAQERDAHAERKAQVEMTCRAARARLAGEDCVTLPSHLQVTPQRVLDRLRFISAISHHYLGSSKTGGAAA